MPSAAADQLAAAVDAARAAPLSSKKAMLAVLLLDAEIDRRFAAAGSGGDRDILAWRADCASQSDALRLIMGLAALRSDGPRLVTEAVEIPIAGYPRLTVADFMVSLYNDHTVQRVRIAMPDGSRYDVHPVLAGAIAVLHHDDARFLAAMRHLAETAMATDRLQLEPLQPDHAGLLLAGFSDPSLYAFIPQDPPADFAALRARFERICRRGPADGHEVWLNWAMRQADGAYCGLLEATARAGGTVDIAYFTFTGHQRQGLAKQAITALLARLSGARAVGAAVDTRNAGSIALLRGLGFDTVATIVGADSFKGASSDEYRFERGPGG